MDVVRPEVGVLPQLSGGRPGGPGERVVVPVVDHPVVLGGQALGDGVEVDGPPPAVAGALGGDDDAGQRPVRLQAVVVEAERFADPAGGHVHLAGQRAFVHDRVRVLVGPVAAGERHVEEVVAGGPVRVHVPPGQHADLVGGPQQSVGAGPLGGGGELDGGVLPGAWSRAAFARPPGDADARLPGGHGGGEMGERRARTPAAVADFGEEGDVPGADRLGDLHLVRLLHGVRGEAVDLGRRDPGVIEGGHDRPAGERLLGLRKPFREGRLSDPGYRRRVLERRHPLTSRTVAPADSGRGYR